MQGDWCMFSSLNPFSCLSNIEFQSNFRSSPSDIFIGFSTWVFFKKKCYLNLFTISLAIEVCSPKKHHLRHSAYLHSPHCSLHYIYLFFYQVFLISGEPKQSPVDPAFNNPLFSNMTWMSPKNDSPWELTDAVNGSAACFPL